MTDLSQQELFPPAGRGAIGTGAIGTGAIGAGAIGAGGGGSGAAGRDGESVASAADYLALMKPRVMSLVVFTAWVGLLAAPGAVHPAVAVAAVACIAAGAGASAALNMWWDRDIDAVMSRTKNRPIPAGRTTAEEALGFGVFLAAASVFVMGTTVNWTAAFLLALTIGFYLVVYTVWLKRRTPHNIVVGGAAGAFPPMIGWAAVTGGVDAGSLSLFALIFLWTPPHFWALALFRRQDYARAGVPMLPVTAGERATKNHMLAYTLLLAPAAAAPWFFGVAGPAYLAVAVVSGAVFIALAVAARRSPDGEYGPAKRMFGYSILHLFLLFAAIAVERLTTGGGT